MPNEARGAQHRGRAIIVPVRDGSMTMKDVSGMKARQAVEDAERLIRMVAQQAKTSLPKAGSIIAKLCAVYAFGLVLASKCCLSSLLVPISVVTLAIAAGWLDAIGQECKHHLYFPYKTLNSVGALLFRWEWTVFWACILFALNLSRAAIIDRVWSLSTMAVAPLALMFLGRALEPYRFHRARRDVSNAEALVRKLLSAQKVSDSVAMAPLIESEKTSLYNLGSFAKLLHGFVAGHKAAQKLSTELSQPCGTVHKGLFKRLLSSIYSPFRTAASEMFLWESWDIVLHIVVALYLGLVYTGSYYFREPMSYWVACCVLVPFVGPKSKAGRYVRALQENIRFAQGSALDKKDKMTVTGDQQSVAKVVNWPMLVYIASVHLTVLYTLVVLIFFGGICPHFDQQGAAVRWETIVLAGALCLCSALGITGGVQRLWSHKSYKAGFPLKVILMVFNSIANQGSIFHWARDHRVHHLYSDTIADPHDANRGFWFSHVGWLLFKKHPAVLEAGRKINVNDRLADPVVMFQKRADPLWNLSWCFGFPAFMVLLWGDTLWNGFLFAGVLRYVFVLNATWAVNSVVHSWGTKPYNPSHRTTENGWVSLFAIGEGWHNWHHAFSWDYAASELEPLYQFNPTKVFIDVSAALGLVWDRKRGDKVWAQRKARWEEANGRKVIESLEGPPLFKNRVVTFGPQEYGGEHQGWTEAHVERKQEVP